jgi:rhomboid family protein
MCGVAAALAHVFSNPGSEIPTVGASGAISGVLGAYVVLHPRAQVLTLFLRFFITLPAFVVLGVWFALQGLSALMDTGGEAGGVAW